MRQRLSERGPLVSLNLANPDDMAYVYDFYGSREALDAFPRTLAAIEAAGRNGSASNYRTEQQYQPGEAPAFCDGICIDFASVDDSEGLITAQSLSGFDHPATFLDHELLLYHTETGEVLARETASTPSPDTERLSLTCHNDALRTLAQDGAETNLMLLYTACWIDGAEGTGAPLRAQVCSRAIDASTLADSGIASVERREPMGRAANPQRDPLPDKDPVVICYNRSADSIDIVYDEEASDINLKVPVAASVTFKAGSSAFDSLDTQNFSLKLFNGGSYTVYETRDRMDTIASSFEATDAGFDFTLPQEWKRGVPTQRLPVRDRVDWSLLASVYHVNGTRSTVFMSSLPDPLIPAGAFYLHVPSLQILWGCLAAGTLVRMADGSERPIENISPGDMVAQRDGCSRVCDVIRGREEVMQVICARGQSGLHTIVATDDHPFRVDGRWVRVRDLTGASILEGESEPLAIESLYPLEQVTEVYNLMLDENGDNSIIANGFIIGDFGAQNRANALLMRAAANPFAAECAAKAAALAALR